MNEHNLAHSERKVSAAELLGFAVLGAVTLYFTLGNHMVPIAGWLMSIGFVRILRNTRLRLGIPITLAIVSFAWLAAFRGLIPLPLPFFIAVGVGSAAAFQIPFLIDRYCHRRIEGFAATLVLPAAAASCDYLFTIVTPYGSWGSAAYSQYGNLAVVQLVALTGLPGIVFLLYWTGSVVNFVLERDFDWARIRTGSVVYSTVVLIVFFAGGLRTVVARQSSDTFRVASITVPQDDLMNASGEARKTGDKSERYPAPVREAAKLLQDDYLTKTAREAEAGATFVIWPEGGCIVRKEDEAAYTERAQALADQHDIYLFMGLVVSLETDWPKLENKVVTIGPDGDILDVYFKTFTVPGDPHDPGEGILPLIDTPYGRVSIAICYDMDFPGLIRQAGRGDADIIIAPSNDWPDIDPMHTMMATFRAVENGAVVIRQTSRGLSIAVDHHGNILASSDYYQTDDHVMVASIPKDSPGSVYAKIGDVFAYAMILGTMVSMGFAALKNSTMSQ